MIEIPNHAQENITLFAGFLMPNAATTPELIAELFEVSGKMLRISEARLNRLAVAELLILQSYAKAKYDSGQAPNTPAWVIHFLEQSPKDFWGAMSDTAKGRRLFRVIEEAMRYSPSDAHSMAVLDLLKTAYSYSTRVNAVAKVAFHISRNILTSTQVKYQISAVRDAAVWGAFGLWAAQKLEEKYSENLTRGVYDTDGSEVRKAYVFLARVLVEAGFGKAEIARALGVERKTVYNWLAA